jgi:hypothetical protein
MTEIKFDELAATVRLLGDGYIKSSQGTLTWSDGWERSLQNSYEPYKAALKQNHTRNPGDVLDRHKVGAAILRSICLLGPLVPATPGPMPPRFSQANFFIAFHVAIHVFRCYALQDARDAGDADAVAMHSAGFILPDPINDDGSYMEQTVKGLFEATKAETLDIFLVANMLYLLDMYHRSAWQLRKARSLPVG